MKEPIQYFYDIVHRVAQQSECKTRQVGAILVRDGTIILEGWNSPPSKCDASMCPRCKNGKPESGTNLDSGICNHAEGSLLSYSARLGIPTLGAEMWLTCKPCSLCSGLISRAGIIKVHYFDEYNSPLTEMILSRGKVELIRYIKTQLTTTGSDEVVESWQALTNKITAY